MIKHGVLWSWDVGDCCHVFGFIMNFEEGVNHGERTDDKTCCVMVWELLNCCSSIGFIMLKRVWINDLELLEVGFWKC